LDDAAAASAESTDTIDDDMRCTAASSNWLRCAACSAVNAHVKPLKPSTHLHQPQGGSHTARRCMAAVQHFCHCCTNTNDNE
jgi:hypothetical protein